jgi:hypothetical protein
MTCPRKITGALLAPNKASAFLVGMASMLGLRSQVTQSPSGATSGPAQITGPRSNNAGAMNGTPTMAQREALAAKYQQTRSYQDLHRLRDVTRAILRRGV